MGTGMNIIRQREKLKELHRRGILETSHLHASLNCPVFEWDPAPDGYKLTEADQKFVADHLQTSNSNVPTCAPFDCFRIVYSFTDCFDQWFYYKQERKWILFRCAAASKETGPEQWFVNVYGFDAGSPCEYRVWVGGKLATHLIMDKQGKIYPDNREIMQECLRTLSYFLFEVMLPGNTVLRVEPPRESTPRSAEWRLARTHYVILNRKQAEQCREKRTGPTTRQIVLAAHWRRAHLRLLRSEKFTHKRGQLIQVSQAWVGPAEWIGLDGKIYKVLNLNEQ